MGFAFSAVGLIGVFVNVGCGSVILSAFLNPLHLRSLPQAGDQTVLRAQDFELTLVDFWDLSDPPKVKVSTILSWRIIGLQFVLEDSAALADLLL